MAVTSGERLPLFRFENFVEKIFHFQNDAFSVYYSIIGEPRLLLTDRRSENKFLENDNI